MRRGNRLIVFAFGLILGAASQPKDAGGHSQYQPTNNLTDAAPAAASGEAVNAINSVIYQPPCTEPKSHDQCDLEAQWKAADSARDAADWAWWQMVIGAFGLAGLLYSLMLTRRATKVAIDATKDADTALEVAKANAKSAADLVENTRDAAHKQLRAYILPAGAGFKVRADGQIDIKLVIRNFGQTPAMQHMCWMHSWVEAFPLTASLPAPPNDFTMSRAVIGQGNHSVFRDSLPRLNEASIRAIEGGTAALYLYGESRYVDVFGVSQQTTFLYFTNMSVGWDRGSFSPYTSGNHAT